MKGVKLSIVFPQEVYDFLKEVCTKMTTIPALNPMTGQKLVDPATGQTVGMSHTGKVEELVHVALISSLVPLIQQNPAFLAETMKLPKFMESYGKYIQTLGDSNPTPKKV
jgi:hypothetical protein